MLGFAVILGLSVVISEGLSLPDNVIPRAEPAFLDILLATKQYDLFSKLMGIENVSLVIPQNRSRRGGRNAMLHKDLKHGDILPSRGRLAEEERQSLRFDENPSLKWSDGYVPFAISKEYTKEERQIILNAIENWNKKIDCIKFRERKREKDYVYYFSGDGCYSNLGKTGGQQPISMETDGCLSQGTINHEMEHAIGMDHEMNRQDRDKYIQILWDNILDEWKDQFEKNDPDIYEDRLNYDYYSLMHYATESPDNEDERAFRILDDSIDEDLVGNADDFTEADIKKLQDLYC